MDIKKLRHAVVLVEEGSFAKASGKLCITQSALSRSIQNLEADLGVTLFDRHASGVWLTQAGAPLIERARELLRMANGLERDARMIKHAELGNLSFGIGPLPAQLLLHKILPGVVASHPRLQIHVHTQPALILLQQLLDEALEFFVADITQFLSQSGIEFQPLALLPAGYFVRQDHPLLSSQPVPLARLEDYPLVSNHFDTTLIQGSGIDRELDWSGWVACDDSRALTAMALDTDAVLKTGESLIQSELDQGLLTPLLIDEIESSWMSDVRVIKLAGRSLSPTAELLITKMKESLHSTLK